MKTGSVSLKSIEERFWSKVNKQWPPTKTKGVCHYCDNPPCVRPSHLFLGTQKQNIQDALKKKVQFGKIRIPDKKIKRVFELRSQGLSQQAIANKLKFSQGHVHRILTYQNRTLTTKKENT